MGAAWVQAHDDQRAVNGPPTSVAFTPSPILAHTHPSRLSQSFSELSGNVIVDDPTLRPLPVNTKVSNFLSSLTGSGSNHSYDLVEDDDYDEPQVTPRVERKMADMTERREDVREEEIPVRTVSISRQLPLNHPKPDLQSLQGAYIKNVDRLEESAERLSMTSSLESELQRIKMEQRYNERKASTSSYAESHRSRLRQFSSHSVSNSIVDVNAAARAGGFSPAAYVTSPVGSLRSPRAGHSSLSGRRASKSSRLGPSLPEPELEGRPLDFGSSMSPRSSRDLAERQPPVSRSTSHASGLGRPGSAGSGDTFQQANGLFTDFDGVHYNGDRSAPPSRQVSLTQPPRARDSRAFTEAQPGEEMVYYPAPVPVMLNLPMRLSKMNWNDREKKRLQALGDMPDDARRSAPWLANEDVAGNVKRQSKLPPQLRASAFFDHRGVEQNLQLKDGSAVATLDSILDAAAHAPVSAFTDHPIAGSLGQEVYGAPAPSRKSLQAQLQPEKKQRRKSSLSNLLSRRSSGNLPAELSRQSRVLSGETVEHGDEGVSGDELDAGAKSIAPTLDEVSDHDDEAPSPHDSETDEDEYRPGFAVAPTTLLAELQMRKYQQKKRNRTAADAFPNGMHSTLLELDTVTQLQQKARKQKHVTLAWEDREEADRENYDDEDIPLGVLFPEKDRQDHVNHNRPLGLMEKRELEENEPLSSRRARLRGEPLPASLPPQSIATQSQAGDVSNAPVLVIPSLHESIPGGDPDESMAERMKRIRDRKERGISGNFSHEVSNDLGLNIEEPAVGQSKTPDVEETLGQRRRRLREEALKAGGARQVSGENGNIAARPALKSTRSLADILQQNPVGCQHPNQSMTSLGAMQNYQHTLRHNPVYLAEKQAASMTFEPPRMQMGMGNVTQIPSMGYPAYQYQSGALPYMGAVQPPMNGFSMPTQMNMNLPYTYNMPGYIPNATALGMGPPLDAKQRATIDRWRQGIA